MAAHFAKVIALALALFTVPSQAADHAGLALSFQVEPSVQDCPTEMAFRATVSARLGYDPFIPEGQPKVVVLVSSEGARLVGHLSWQEPGGTSGGLRAFTNKVQNCGELVENMAFALAVQIQLLWGDLRAEGPQTAAQKGASEEPPERPLGSALEKKPNPARTIDSAPPASPSPPTEPSRLAVLVGAGPSLGFGLVPQVAVLGRVFVGLRAESVSMELAAEASSAGTLTREGGGGFDARVYAASGAACFQRAPWFGCGVGRVGTLSVRGFGVDEPKAASGWVAWLGVRVGARLPLSRRSALGASADLDQSAGEARRGARRASRVAPAQHERDHWD